jgi:hypothetical protein
MAAALSDADFCSLPSLSNASAFHQSPSTYAQCFASNLVHSPRASHVDYDSSNGCSLHPSTSLHDSFDISDRVNMVSLRESKIESEDSWEYSSLHLSPDVTSTADTLFGEFEEYEARETQ